MSERVMTFGKFKGTPVAEVIAQHPDYALWAHENVSFFNLTVSEIQDCVSRSRAGNVGILPSHPSDDDGPDVYLGLDYSDFGNN